MRHLLACTAATLTLLASACTPRAVVPTAEQERVQKELSGQQRYLRVAANVGPLWGDTRKLLVADQPAAEIDLVLSPGGDVIAPPRFDRVLRPGTPVRIESVEFPAGWLIAERVVTTPRYHPWVYVRLPGETRPGVLVLSQTVETFDDVRGELERMLTADDPSAAFNSLAPEYRNAILRKEAIEGMSPAALEMAWGVPERKRIDRPSHTEEWSWPGGKRRAFLRDDRVERLEK
ncbi:MAG: hypothetical protein QM767_06810 [Anaeromyxobacter sp.]